MVNRFRRFIRNGFSLPKLFQAIAGQCILCAAPGQKGLDLCQQCELDLPLLASCCQQCALPLPDDDSSCGRCLVDPPPYRYTQAPWLYQPPVAQLISRFKYNRQYSIGRVLSTMAASKYVSAYSGCNLPDIIVPIPLHWQRHITRGFNQSEHLARYYAGHLGIPMQRVLKRCKSTTAQQTLNAEQRRRNLKGAFKVIGDVCGKRVVVVDDVMTTGTTVGEASRCLLKAGASEVHVWCLARTE